VEARVAELAGTVRALTAGLARVEREVAALGQALVAAEVQVGALERARLGMVAALKQHRERADALQVQVDALAAAGDGVGRAVAAVQARTSVPPEEAEGGVAAILRAFVHEDEWKKR
jgi:phage-related minor tail protein